MLIIICQVFIIQEEVIMVCYYMIIVYQKFIGILEISVLSLKVFILEK